MLESNPKKIRRRLLRLLLIEDNPHDRQLVERELRRYFGARLPYAALKRTAHQRQLKRYRALKRTLLAQLRMHERRKDELIATLVHELRNLLAPIRSATRLLEPGVEPRLAANAPRIIERQLTHIAHLLNELLDSARIADNRTVTLDDDSSGAGTIRQRILVVDDNADAADVLQSLLRLAGHDACVAYDGRSALAVAERVHPDVVLLDIGLPDISGHEVARQLREVRGKGLRLVAITGWGEESDRHRSAAAGFDLHLTKPVDSQLLLALLASAEPEHHRPRDVERHIAARHAH